MFSGIVVEVGLVQRVGEGRIEVSGATALNGRRAGASVAVNGVCLTIAELGVGSFTADVMPETMRRTTLGALAPGDRVNLEPALSFGEEVGGHLVQGHVDTTGEVVGIRDEGNARWVEIQVPPELLPFCVEKGSIAVDGTSLTISSLVTDVVGLSLIPHTLGHTVAGAYAPGTRVNLEVDVLARYVARYMAGINPGPTEGGGHPTPAPAGG